MDKSVNTFQKISFKNIKCQPYVVILPGNFISFGRYLADISVQTKEMDDHPAK